MACPNCNRLRTGRNCYVHNVITCLYCLYDGVGTDGKHFCDAESFIVQSIKYKTETEAEMDALLDKIPRDNTWIPM